MVRRTKGTALTHGVPLSVLLAATLACGTPGPSVTGPSPAVPATGEPPPSPSPPGDALQFTGLVASLTGACPSITFQAGGHDVTAAESTSYQSGTCADVRRGALLSIEGLELNGVVVPERVRLESDGPADAGLLSDVAGGGYVLFFRHAERDAGAIQTDELQAADNVAECLPGSELTATGRADSEALGERFRRYGIAVQKVYSSPTCRTTEMARLAFGDPFETTRALLWRDVWGPGEAETLDPVLRQLLSTPPQPRKTIVLLSHNDLLNKSPLGLPLALEQAEAAVFRPLGGNAYEYVGRIPKAVWMGRR